MVSTADNAARRSASRAGLRRERRMSALDRPCPRYLLPFSTPRQMTSPEAGSAVAAQRKQRDAVGTATQALHQLLRDHHDANARLADDRHAAVRHKRTHDVDHLDTVSTSLPVPTAGGGPARSGTILASSSRLTGAPLWRPDSARCCRVASRRSARPQRRARYRRPGAERPERSQAGRRASSLTTISANMSGGAFGRTVPLQCRHVPRGGGRSGWRNHRAVRVE